MQFLFVMRLVWGCVCRFSWPVTVRLCCGNDRFFSSYNQHQAEICYDRMFNSQLWTNEEKYEDNNKKNVQMPPKFMPDFSKLVAIIQMVIWSH